MQQSVFSSAGDGGGEVDPRSCRYSESDGKPLVKGKISVNAAEDGSEVHFLICKQQSSHHGSSNTNLGMESSSSQPLSCLTALEKPLLALLSLGSLGFEDLSVCS